MSSREMFTQIHIDSKIKRWAGIGPYYAMFPIDFAFEVVNEYSNKGDIVFDPFAGRASSVYAAASLERQAYGIEINPVGWLYGKVKLCPGKKEKVIERIKEIGVIALKEAKISKESYTDFFRLCYTPKVFKFLLKAREMLSWRKSIVDATVMALILVYLHGKMGQSLSNQMRQGKAMSPDYSIQWWQKKDLTPPDIDPVEFLIKRVEWRYAKGVPSFNRNKIFLGDSTKIIPKIETNIKKGLLKPFNLLFTSPPYYEITNYFYDQWLRLWMLGEPNYPISRKSKYQGKFTSKEEYKKLLKKVFFGSSELMSKDAIIYVRTDARQFTFETTLEILKAAYPQKRMEVIPRPFTKKTQTALYGDTSEKPGEIDIICK